MGTKCCRRYPSFDASSTTKLSAPNPSRVVICVDVPAGVLDPGVGVRREVRVLGEDLFGWDELGDLDEPALLACTRVKRIERLAGLELLGGQDRLAER